MNPSMINAIQARLATAKKMLSADDRSQANSLPTIAAKEFRTELAKLDDMLKDPVSFESRLRERCSKRSHHHKKFIAPRFVFDTLSNKLYWDLAKIVFQPKSMQEMFSIMLPDVKRQLTIENYDPDSLQRDNNIAPQPHLVSAPLSLLNDAPVNFDELSRYVIMSDTVFDLHTTAGLSDKQLSDIRKKIAINAPELHESITQQIALRKLQINPALMSSPSTPREALKHLFFHVDLASPKHTKRSCGADAGNTAFTGIAAFIEFRDSIHGELLSALYGLPLHKHTDKTFRAFITYDVCRARVDVDAIASDLSKFLDTHAAPHPILDSKVTLKPSDDEDSLTREELNLKTLTTLIEPSNTKVKSLPEVLANALLPQLHREVTRTELTSQLMQAPTEFYELIVEKNAKTHLNTYLNVIDNGYLNTTQTSALMSAVARYFQHDLRSLIQWTIDTRQTHLFKVVLESCPASVCFTAMYAGYPGRHNILNYCKSAEQVYLVLNHVSEENSYELIVRHNFHVDSAEVQAAIVSRIKNFPAFISTVAAEKKSSDDDDVLSHTINAMAAIDLELAKRFAREVAARAPLPRALTSPTDDWLRKINNLEIIRDVTQWNPGLTEQDVVKFLVSPDTNDNNIFHLNTNHDVIEFCLHKTPKKNRFAPLMTKNSARVFALGREDLPLATFKLMLKSLPPHQRYSAVTAPMLGDQGILYRNTLLDITKRVPAILRLLHPREQVKAVLEPFDASEERYSAKTTLMHRAASASKTELLRGVLTAIEPSNRLAVLLTDDHPEGQKRSTLDFLCKQAAYATVAVELLPEKDVSWFLLCERTRNGQTILQNMLSDVNFDTKQAKAFFRSFSDATLTRLFTRPTHGENSLFHHFPYNRWALLPSILARLPENIVFAFLKYNLYDGLSDQTPDIINKCLNMLNDINKRIILRELLQILISDAEKFEGILKLIPAEERLDMLLSDFPSDPDIKKYFADENPTLLNMYWSTLLITLELLPPNQRLAFMLTKLPNGRTVIENTITRNIHDFILMRCIDSCIKLLPDEDSLQILSTKVNGVTVLQHYSEQRSKAATATYNRFGLCYTWNCNLVTLMPRERGRSFIQEYLAIATFLYAENNRLNENDLCCSRFFYSNPAAKLLSELKQCKSIDALKETLLTHMSTPGTHFRKNLVEALAFDRKAYDPVADISQRWKVNIPSQQRQHGCK